MRSPKRLLFETCPQSGKIGGVKSPGGLARICYPLIGLLALIWIIIRVLPKPGRAAYPCMRIAFPVATGYIAHLFGLFVSLLAFSKAKQKLSRSLYLAASVFVILGIAASFMISEAARIVPHPPLTKAVHESNQPIGQAKGIFAGRVVWVYNPDATNEDCNPEQPDDGWYLNKNNNQDVIDAMLDSAVTAITGATTVAAAWDSIFVYNNSNRGKGDVGYQAGEIIFIKVNRTSAYAIDPSDLSRINYETSETSPHLVLSLLRHLVNEVRVAEKDIYIGDPMKHIYKLDYELWHAEFDSIHYLDHDRSDFGREIAAVGDSMIHYSDSGVVLREGTNWYDASSGDPIYDDYFYEILEDCEYLINVPTLKGHKRAGITMFAKNQFGSHTRSSAKHLHMGLVVPDEYPNEQNARYGYRKYRVLVDLMGWKLISEKNLIFLMDALWSAGWELDAPGKWTLPPFKDDWSSSIFISQDPLAIESVGYDFLRTEYTAERHPELTYPQLEGADDYLHQAADSSTWPEDVCYDPEDDGTPIASLGTHEHWNNARDKQYSRNLGTGVGIELIQRGTAQKDLAHTSISPFPQKLRLLPNYPNPFNASTTISYEIAAPALMTLTMYDIVGRRVEILVNRRQQPGHYSVQWDATGFPSGLYYYRIQAAEKKQVGKCLLMK